MYTYTYIYILYVYVYIYIFEFIHRYPHSQPGFPKPVAVADPAVATGHEAPRTHRVLRRAVEKEILSRCGGRGRRELRRNGPRKRKDQGIGKNIESLLRKKTYPKTWPMKYEMNSIIGRIMLLEQLVEL